MTTPAAPIKKYESQYAYDCARQRRNKRNAYLVRQMKKYPQRTQPKLGCLPISIMSPAHPARMYGWGDDRTLLRDRSKWA